MSGAGIGTAAVITIRVPLPILRVLHRALPVCIGAAVGPASRSSAVRPIATSTPRASGPTTWVSGLSAPQISSKECKQTEHPYRNVMEQERGTRRVNQPLFWAFGNGVGRSLVRFHQCRSPIEPVSIQPQYDQIDIRL